MAKPATTLEIGVTGSSWATDAAILSGTETGAATKVDPGDGYRAQGFVPGLAFIGPYLNHLLNNIGQWVKYLDGITTDVQFLASTFAWTGAHTFTRSTAGGNGLTATGNTTGAGVRGSGGASGHGVHGTGGGATGAGGYFAATAAANPGAYCYGVTSGHGCEGYGGTTGAGFAGIGGTTSGAGVVGIGDGASLPTMTKEGVAGQGGPGAPGGKFYGPASGAANAAVFAVGAAGNNEGVNATGSGTGAGGSFFGGASAGSGVRGEGLGNGHGGDFQGQGSGTGVTAEGGTAGSAIAMFAGSADAPHLRFTNTCNAAPSGAINGDVWYAADGMYFRSAGGVVFAFKAAGFYIDGALKVAT